MSLPIHFLFCISTTANNPMHAMRINLSYHAERTTSFTFTSVRLVLLLNDVESTLLRSAVVWRTGNSAWGLFSKVCVSLPSSLTEAVEWQYSFSRYDVCAFSFGKSARSNSGSPSQSHNTSCWREGVSGRSSRLCHILMRSTSR